MAAEFDAGYGNEPFAGLCRAFPGPDAYPPDDFRVEWGPVFHRGRLDGSARLLVLGQDPGPHEAVARRVLVGEAGQRVQGFLGRLGVTVSYVMVNAFLYSVFGQGGGERHVDDAAIAAYRHRWLEALLAPGRVDAVVAFGHLADKAWQAWRRTAAGRDATVTYVPLTHPTQPDAVARGDQARFAAAMRAMLAQWNRGLAALAPAVGGADRPGDPRPYGTTLTAADHATIPAADLPAGLPAWMGGLEEWAVRRGPSGELKRATLVVTVPEAARPWRGS
jgi:uracil-DNA glycosylase